jgi:basic amino acid/polyamine antiporter, APA family
MLKRELGIPAATLMGLGSIVGTGVFVSLGVGAGIAGAGVILAIALGALIAICNGLSAAQLAASHPVSGGSYEYGYKYLSPAIGFTAGWMFLIAKTASAATAALGFAGYLVPLLGVDPGLTVPIAVIAVLVLTAVVLGGVRRSNRMNTAIVAITLLSLGVFVVACLPSAIAQGSRNFIPLLPESPANLLQATALMFVAYTGYGRIATLGEEAHNPRFTIPRAMILCLGITMVLYLTVAIAGIGAVGAVGLSQATQQTQAAPLAIAMGQITGQPGVILVSVGAIAAMLGVLLNLILGLSRVLLAMGRRRDMPSFFAQLNQAQTTPYWAVLGMGGAIALLTLVGNVKTTWSFSAFSVLIYYGITNWATLKLAARDRLYPRWIAWVGLASCFFLAFWVDSSIWITGLWLIFLGLIWHSLARRKP